MRLHRGIPVLAAAALAATAATAGAHTSATCTLRGGQAGCLGTIANEPVDPSPAWAQLTLAGSRGHLFIDAQRLVGLFDRGMLIDADLSCIDEMGGVSCSGQSETAGLPVAVRATGNGTDMLISLTDGTEPPASAPATSAAASPKAHLAHHRTRHHRRRHHRRH